MSIFAIRNKETGTFCVWGSKCAWVSAGAAKNAYALHMSKPFDSQSKHEMVDLTEAYYRLEGLDK